MNQSFNRKGWGILKFLIGFWCLALVLSCTKDSSANLIFQSPKLKIIDEAGIRYPNSGFPRKEFTVQNSGKGPTAYNAKVFVTIKRGNHIVAESGVGFGALEENESKTKEVVLFDLKKGDNFDKVEIELYWENAEGNKYWD